MSPDSQPDVAGASGPKILLYLEEMRLPFLTASLVPVLVGAALAFHRLGRCDWLLFALTLVGMGLAHAAANVANDYFDHLSGNDEANQSFVRPFTGGSRLIQNGLLKPVEVRNQALLLFVLAAGVGAYVAFRVGWPVLALGAFGLACGYFYTAPPVRLASRGLGELVVALCFGVLPVLGAYYVQVRRMAAEALVLSLPVALLVAAVLFINQFQDREADAAVGKCTWVVRLGLRRSVVVYAVLMFAWVVPLIAGVELHLLPPLAMAGLIPVALSFYCVLWTAHNYEVPLKLAAANAMTIFLHLSVGLLIAGGLVASTVLFGVPAP